MLQPHSRAYFEKRDFKENKVKNGEKNKAGKSIEVLCSRKTDVVGYATGSKQDLFQEKSFSKKTN